MHVIHAASRYEGGVQQLVSLRGSLIEELNRHMYMYLFLFHFFFTGRDKLSGLRVHV